MASIRERFWSKVDITGPDECWDWTGCRNNHGYGVLGVNYRRWSTHRVAWAFANGPIPEGMCICHHCDNPACCNPAHLFLGTHKDNLADMVAKGRQGRRKLTPTQVLEIRALHGVGGVTKVALAAEYGVSSSAIDHIIARRCWAHLKETELDRQLALSSEEFIAEVYKKHAARLRRHYNGGETLYLEDTD